MMEQFKMKRTINGVGFIGEGKYVTSINGRKTQEYVVFNHLMQRCYNPNRQKNQPTYIGCSVVEEWHNFQNFAKWFNENYIEGFELDKDILIKGNKIYGPDTCCFVPKAINSLFVKSNNSRGKYPIGINKKKNKFQAQVTINSRLKYLGIFDTIEEAFTVYKQAKEHNIKTQTYLHRQQLKPEIVEALLKYKVEITD